MFFFFPTVFDLCNLFDFSLLKFPCMFSCIFTLRFSLLTFYVDFFALKFVSQIGLELSFFLISLFVLVWGTRAWHFSYINYKAFITYTQKRLGKNLNFFLCSDVVYITKIIYYLKVGWNSGMVNYWADISLNIFCSILCYLIQYFQSWFLISNKFIVYLCSFLYFPLYHFVYRIYIMFNLFFLSPKSLKK